MEKVRELPPVSFSYSGQLVDNRRAPADFIQFWLRKGAHVVIYGHWVCRWPPPWAVLVLAAGGAGCWPG
ncbi:hypothetical protein [Desulfofundulus australicus]|uniref:hypothetical protein n=1 Tax=Desulfofundulus australicus TaxID=1566 RepID=UPI000934F66A|nr:hypothetical protein [Desulfofundulus australicus]